MFPPYFRSTFLSLTQNYEIPAVQGETGLQKAISVMLRRFMEINAAALPADPGMLALRFAWWLFDHPEELEATAVEMESMKLK